MVICNLAALKTYDSYDHKELLMWKVFILAQLVKLCKMHVEAKKRLYRATFVFHSAQVILPPGMKNCHFKQIECKKSWMRKIGTVTRGGFNPIEKY